MNNMTRRDIIIKWIAYLIALGLAAVVNFYVLGPLPIPLPLMLPVLAVAGGTLEGPRFGALYGMAVPELLCSLAFILPVYWAGRFCCIHYGRIYHE